LVHRHRGGRGRDIEHVRTIPPVLVVVVLVILGLIAMGRGAIARSDQAGEFIAKVHVRGRGGVVG
jgi:uncharacterized membrane protein YqiK